MTRALVVCALALQACVPRGPGARMPAPGGPVEVGATEEGLATWYGATHHGRTTASGESFDMDAMTAAHKTLPLGTVVRVTNRENGRSVVVRINDRGPYGEGRIIDLARAAAEKIGMIRAGVVRVRVEVLAPDEAP